MKHPFYVATYNGHECYCMTADDRVKRVAEFDLITCSEAMKLDDLQTTVKRAIERRMRTLKARSAKPPPSAKFAVVLNPGTLFQSVDVYAGTLQSALDWACSMREPGVEVDVMRVMHDGTLTTDL